MNIIFGKENLPQLDNKYSVLELDSFRFKPHEQVVTAYCVVENIPINNLSQTQEMLELHNNLIKNYREKNWNYCSQALNHLRNFWGPEMTTFYQELEQRIAKYNEQDPGELWDGIIEKTAG